MSTEAQEVAEDYRLALEDLNANTRFEISNLTVIARENTEHALVIAEVLEKHILKTAPSKKLPALYVLDSIVKNVGTPYTLYLGRNIFKIFMEAYTVVDNSTRKRMEEMMRTWKLPVAGSMDTRPVFPLELVRPIENALNKAKAAMMPQQPQLPGRPRSAMPPHRDTPTPPGFHSGTGTPNHFVPPPQQYPNAGQPGLNPQFPGQFNNMHLHSAHTTPQPIMSSSFQPPVAQNNAYGAAGGASGNAIDKLAGDIQNLITVMRMEAAQKPHDASLQTRLGALQDLQRIVQSTTLPPDQLEAIKKQVTDLATVTLRASSARNSTPPTHAPPLPPPPPPQAQPAPYSVAPLPAPAAATATAAPGSVSLDSLLGAGAMAALMGRQGSQNSTPIPPPSAHAAIRSPQPPSAEPYRAPPPPPAQSQNGGGALSLMDQLRAAGLIQTPSQNTPVAAAPPPPPPSSHTAPSLPTNLAELIASAKSLSSTLAKPPSNGLTAGILERPANPNVIRELYEGLGPPCTQCGRRFKTDEEGRKQKMAHMDWHFRVHQRSSEAAKLGTHRTWYVDAQDWIKSHEVLDADDIDGGRDVGAQSGGSGGGGGGGGGSNPSQQTSKKADTPRYIPVPDASRGISNVCPICQDSFQNSWLDEVQEWVWLDGVIVNNRVYHASCRAATTRERETTPGLRRTPEPVLGKRKADVSLASPKVRSLKTSG